MVTPHYSRGLMVYVVVNAFVVQHQECALPIAEKPSLLVGKTH